MRILKLTFSFVLGTLALLPPQSALAENSELAVELAHKTPHINPHVLELAVEAMDCAVANGMTTSSKLAVIDYSRPSQEPRLWVFDLENRRLLFEELVAHGRNTGDNLAQHFSNEPDSLESSLGLFRTQGTYQGGNGYSLRLDGLEPGFNDRARERAIVMHGAPYVNADTARNLGRLGRSWGCPAVRLGIARQVIDALKGGQFIFSYYPEQRWLTESRFLNCKSSDPQTLTASATH